MAEVGQHVHEQQVVEQHPPGIDEAFGDGPVVVAALFCLEHQQFGQVDRTPPASKVNRLMMTHIAEAEQRIALHQGDTDRCFDQSSTEVGWHFLEDSPERQDAFVSGVQVRQAAILGKVRQARLLTEQDRLVGTCDGPIDLVVAHLSIEDAQIRFTSRWRFGQIGGRSVVGG